jgi:hypothetical protein
MTESELHAELARLIDENRRRVAAHLERVAVIREAIAAKVSERRDARHARQQHAEDERRKEKEFERNRVAAYEALKGI